MISFGSSLMHPYLYSEECRDWMHVSTASLESFIPMTNEVTSLDQLGRHQQLQSGSFFWGCFIMFVGLISLKVSHLRKDCLSAYKLHTLLLISCILRVHPELTTWSCSLQSHREAPRTRGTLYLVIHAYNCFPMSLIQATRMCLSCFKETGNLS